jgi:squalene cyclase
MSVRASIAHGLRFLSNVRRPDGLWEDFMTLAGRSVDWASGFVCASIAGLPGHRSLTLPCASALLRRRRRSGGWGYNSGVPEDCDSTAWALQAVLAAAHLPPMDVRRAQDFMSRHQSPISGGFTTYVLADAMRALIDAPNIEALEGWTSEHPCVTAVALTAALSHGEPTDDPLVVRSTAYLLNCRDADGLWNSYWWPGYAYATYFSARVLARAGRLDRNDRLKTAAAVVARVGDDGSWDGLTSRGEVFSTALSIGTLLLAPDSPAAVTAARRGIQWLVERQLADGSWPAAPILRIPPSHVQDPETVKRWRSDDLGTGVIISDQSRTFTSAAALHVLGVYHRMYGLGVDRAA